MDAQSVLLEKANSNFSFEYARDEIFEDGVSTILQDAVRYRSYWPRRLKCSDPTMISKLMPRRCARRGFASEILQRWFPGTNVGSWGTGRLAMSSFEPLKE
jgi:hypothetical protein